MAISPEQTAMLSAKLDIANVKKPDGKFGPKGDYIEGWFAIQEANRIFGFDGWTYEILNLAQCHEPFKNDKGNWGVGYICTISIVAIGCQRQDVGYGSGFSANIGDAHESAAKEAVTDALKRALRTFGNPFGLALYDKKRANVEDAAAVAAEQKSKADAREIYETLQIALRECEGITLQEFDDWKKGQVAAFKSLPSDWQKSFKQQCAEMRDTIAARTAQQMIGA